MTKPRPIKSISPAKRNQRKGGYQRQFSLSATSISKEGDKDKITLTSFLFFLSPIPSLGTGKGKRGETTWCANIPKFKEKGDLGKGGEYSTIQPFVKLSPIDTQRNDQTVENTWSNFFFFFLINYQNIKGLSVLHTHWGFFSFLSRCGKRDKVPSPSAKERVFEDFMSRRQFSCRRGWGRQTGRWC